MIAQMAAGFIAPCLPTKTAKPPSGSQWLHEIKHDGFRIIARNDGQRVRLYSRPGNDFTRPDGLAGLSSFGTLGQVQPLSVATTLAIARLSRRASARILSERSSSVAIRERVMAPIIRAKMTVARSLAPSSSPMLWASVAICTDTPAHASALSVGWRASSDPIAA
jgi:hypothetical protein